ENVQQSEAQYATFTWDPERGSDRGRVHDRFVDDEIDAVIAVDRFETLQVEIGEQFSVERGGFAPSAADARAPYDVVFDVVREGRDDGVDVFVELRLEVFVDDAVKFGGVQKARHGSIL